MKFTLILCIVGLVLVGGQAERFLIDGHDLYTRKLLQSVLNRQRINQKLLIVENIFGENYGFGFKLHVDYVSRDIGTSDLLRCQVILVDPMDTNRRVDVFSINCDPHPSKTAIPEVTTTTSCPT